MPPNQRMTVRCVRFTFPFPFPVFMAVWPSFFLCRFLSEIDAIRTPLPPDSQPFHIFTPTHPSWGDRIATVVSFSPPLSHSRSAVSTPRRVGRDRGLYYIPKPTPVFFGESHRPCFFFFQIRPRIFFPFPSTALPSFADSRASRDLALHLSPAQRVNFILRSLFPSHSHMNTSAARIRCFRRRERQAKIQRA